MIWEHLIFVKSIFLFECELLAELAWFYQPVRVMDSSHPLKHSLRLMLPMISLQTV